MGSASARSLFSILDDDVLTTLVGTFSYPTLCRLRSTCTTADAVVAREMEFRYSKGLRDFVSDSSRLRTMLRRTNSAISGSFAVTVATGHRFPPGDLDLYTSADTLQEVLRSLAEDQYRVVGEDDSLLDEYRGGILRVVYLTNGRRKIDLVVSCTSSAILPVAYFWSTTVMVYFGADGFCCLYPTWLEHARGLINPGRMPMDGDLLAALRHKYGQRGFDIRETEEDWPLEERISAQCKHSNSPTCPVTTRYIGDRFTLQASFRRVQERLTMTAFSGNLATLTTVWWRGGVGCGGQCNEDGQTEFDAWTQEADMVGM